MASTPLESWVAVDRYFSETLVRADDALDEAVRASEAAGLPSIQVAPNQGKLLQLLAQTMGARRILEIGTLGGYSTICLARGLAAGGRLITLELEKKHADIARANLQRARVADRVEVRVGPALESLAQIAKETREPFDLIFIDADKKAYPEYFQWSLKLARRGTLIIADNVVRNGAVADATSADETVRGVRRFTEMVAAEKRVSATAIQTVGTKGHDGFAFVLVTAD